jgi:hypothetical protein
MLCLHVGAMLSEAQEYAGLRLLRRRWWRLCYLWLMLCSDNPIPRVPQLRRRRVNGRPDDSSYNLFCRYMGDRRCGFFGGFVGTKRLPLLYLPLDMHSGRLHVANLRV